MTNKLINCVGLESQKYHKGTRRFVLNYQDTDLPNNPPKYKQPEFDNLSVANQTKVNDIKSVAETFTPQDSILDSWCIVDEVDAKKTLLIHCSDNESGQRLNAICKMYDVDFDQDKKNKYDAMLTLANSEMI